jgi:hypothetical protein
MANILDRYGIKEVADVTFYELSNTGLPTKPVLYLDTLKVSTIEQTAEEAEARGGKGNAALIAWDYGKEINVTLEDALFSAKSMAIMFGNGTVKKFDSKGKTTGATKDDALIMKTIQVVPTKEGEDPNGGKWTGPDGKQYTMIDPVFYDAEGTKVEQTELKANERYLCTFDLTASGAVIEVSGNSFPGTYYVVGDTFARSEASGLDEMFQFIIPKAKVTSENTITLEAEGDPSVFNMSLKVLRPADGIMMKLVKYNLEDALDDAEAETDAKLVHNHYMVEAEEAGE